MPMSVLGWAPAPPPVPSGPTIDLRVPFTGTVTLVFPWGTTITNPTITTAVDEAARITGTVF